MILKAIRRCFLAVVTYLYRRWERLLFAFAGVGLLGLALNLLYHEKLAQGSALFGMGFFSIFYSNISRFKRFKGLGFEAELWEDKQKEAANLIERMKGIVTTYTREILMASLRQGRWDSANGWKEQWALFDELTGQHNKLGQNIDFSEVKKEIDTYFVFDICYRLHDMVSQPVRKVVDGIQNDITVKYGNPITDSKGYAAELAKLNGFPPRLDGLSLNDARNGNLAQKILDFAENRRTNLKAIYGVEPIFDQISLDRLKTMSGLIRNGPIKVSPELIQWAEQ